jgi:hypothetical protein
MRTQSQRHAASDRTRRWRERVQRGAAVYPVEVEAQTFSFMQKFAGLHENKVGDRNAVRAALGRLLRRGLNALLELEALRRH